jgi:hypothetical protein
MQPRQPLRVFVQLPSIVAIASVSGDITFLIVPLALCRGVRILAGPDR